MSERKELRLSTYGAIREYIESCEALPGDRDIGKGRRDGLTNRITGPEGIRLVFRFMAAELPTGRRIRVDGQLGSQLNLDGVIPDETIVLFEVWECDTIEEVRILWCQHDHAQSHRNPADVATNFLVGDHQFDTCQSKWNRAKLVVGIAQSETGYFLGGKVPRTSIEDASRDAHAQGKFAAQFGGFANEVKNPSGWLWKTSAVIAALCDFWKRTEDAKHEAWYGFMNELTEPNDGRYHPAAQLRRGLVGTTGVRPERHTPAEKYYATERCTRAFETGTHVKTMLWRPPVRK